MIRHLHIENYALIEHLDLDLHHGFSVITGETGAGKSIIIGAIGLLMGQRADSRAIKTGAKRCVVEIEFDVRNYGMESFFEENDLDYDDGCCIIRRELTVAGKSRAFINDTPVQLALLKEIGEVLIDVHSQHKNLLLGKENFQMSTLDILAQNDELLAEYRSKYTEYKLLKKKLEDAAANAKSSKEEEDFLRFQLDQLTEADLHEGEQEELEEEQDKLEHAEEIKKSLYGASACLQADGDSADVLSLIRQGISELHSISSVYPAAGELAERMDSCYIELKDVSGELEGMADDVEYNPQRLERVDNRLNTIYTLQKKHDVETVGELLTLQKELEDKLQDIDGSGERVEHLKLEVEVSRAEALVLAEKLSAARKIGRAHV